MKSQVDVAQSRLARPYTLETLAHAWRALVHPITWASVFVLLVNDHLLRWRWSGWVTGKLGDVAWLAFAPLVVALALAALRRTSRKDPEGVDAVMVVATALVGGIFTIVKAVPVATEAFLIGFRTVLGWSPLLVCDPTDLLALPALGIAWVVWRRTGEARRQSSVPVTTRHTPRLTAWGWATLALALLATLGNSGPPETGIVCVKGAEEVLLAGSRYDYGRTGSYESRDGGVTWTGSSQEINAGAEPACAVPDGEWTLALPDGAVHYRFVPGSLIERSVDGGATWATDLVLRGSEARLAYIQQARAGATGYPGPHSAVFDPATGNLVLAMGLEGVLVRRDAATAASSAERAAATDLWQWAPVGDYQFEPVTPVNAVMRVLVLERWLAVSVVLLTVAFAAWGLFTWPVRAVTVVWALAVEMALLVLRPALMTGYATMVGWAVSLGLGVGSLILCIVAGIWIWRRGVPGEWRGLLVALGIGAAGGVLFLTPLVLWAVGLISLYVVAMSIAALLAASIWVSRVIFRIRTR